MSTDHDMDALATRMTEQILRDMLDKCLLAPFLNSTASNNSNLAFPFIEPKFDFELNKIYVPERDGPDFVRMNWYNHVVVHQPSALLMVTACDSEGVFLTDRECRAIENWNRAKARKDRRRTKYWAGVCLKLQRNGH